MKVKEFGTDNEKKDNDDPQYMDLGLLNKIIIEKIPDNISYEILKFMDYLP